MTKTIAFITDLHLGENLPVDVDARKNWLSVLADARARNVDEIVIGGDICEASHYAEFFETLSESGRNANIIAGNHDGPGALLQHFANPEHPDSHELYYSFNDEHFLYVFLDSSSGAISDAQLHWLERKLDENHLKVLLFVHHPIFEIDSYVDRTYPLQNRNAVRQLLENQRFEVFVFCGHCHCEDETGSGAISQYETPAVSYQINKATTNMQPHADYFGYRLITLDHANVRTELILLQP